MSSGFNDIKESIARRRSFPVYKQGAFAPLACTGHTQPQLFSSLSGSVCSALNLVLHSFWLNTISYIEYFWVVPTEHTRYDRIMAAKLSHGLFGFMILLYSSKHVANT